MSILSIDVGRKNLALCLLAPAASPEQDRILHWEVLACEPTCQDLLRAVKDTPWALHADEVVIERQPPQNPTMTRLQHYLEAYFELHAKQVYVQDSKHKLAFAANTAWWPQGIEGWSYSIRKKASVNTTRAFLTDTASEFLQAFEAAKKKDDLGDSLLQAMAYAHHVKPAKKRSA